MRSKNPIINQRKCIVKNASEGKDDTAKILGAMRKSADAYIGKNRKAMRQIVSALQTMAEVISLMNNGKEIYRTRISLAGFGMNDSRWNSKEAQAISRGMAVSDKEFMNLVGKLKQAIDDASRIITTF